MAITLESRDPTTHEIIVSEAIPAGATLTGDRQVPDGSNGVPAATPPPAGETESAGDSAPQSPTPDAGVSQVAAPSAPADSETDDDDEPDIATIDSVQKRLKRYTARWRATERALEAERQARDQDRLRSERDRAALQGRVDQLTAFFRPDDPSPTPPAPVQEPRREDFPDPQAHAAAMTDYVARRAMQEELGRFRSEQERQSASTEVSRRLQASAARAQAFAQDHDDYQAVVRQAYGQGQLPPSVQEALVALENGPALLYALATLDKSGQGQTAAYLGSLPTEQLYLHLGQLSAVVQAQASQTPPAAPTGAVEAARPPAGQTAPPAPLHPPPLSPVSGAGGTTPPDDPTTWSQAEFRKRFNDGWRPRPDQLRR